MQKIYSRINWENSPSANTPLGENNLNAMDYALDEIDNRVVSLSGYQDRAAESEENAKTSENNAKQSELNAKQSELLAKEYKDKAFTYTPDGYEDMVDEVFGLDVKSSTKSPLLNTRNGGLRFNTIKGKSEQDTEPTPTNPVPVKNAFDCVELMQGYYTTSDGTYSTDSRRICTKNYIPCVSGDVILIETDTNYSFYVSEYSDSGYVSFQSKINTNKAEFTVPSGITKVALRVENAIVENPLTPSTVGKVKLTINGKYLVPIKTTDGNGKESTEYIKLSDSLRGIGDLKDEIVRKNSVWGVQRRFAEETFDGSDDERARFSYSLIGDGVSYRWVISVPNAKIFTDGYKTANIISNRYAPIPSNSLWAGMQGISVAASSRNLLIFSDELNDNDVTTVIESFSGNPLTVVYELATPTFEELSTEDQIALNSLETFDGATSISFDSVVQPTFEVEYGESKVGAYTLKALNTSESNEIRYKELAVALVATGSVTNA